MTGPLVARADRPIIYLAGRYSRREELRGYAAQLEELGLARVTARWLLEEHDWDGSAEGESLDKARQYAIDDLEDIEAAHAVVVFTEAPGGTRRGGRHVEYGWAISRRKHVVIVGPAENVFYTLASVPRYATWPDAVAHLVKWRAAAESARIRQRLVLQ